jgi:hypothetical protein
LPARRHPVLLPAGPITLVEHTFDVKDPTGGGPR